MRWKPWLAVFLQLAVHKGKRVKIRFVPKSPSWDPKPWNAREELESEEEENLVKWKMTPSQAWPLTQKELPMTQPALTTAQYKKLCESGNTQQLNCFTQARVWNEQWNPLMVWAVKLWWGGWDQSECSTSWKLSTLIPYTSPRKGFVIWGKQCLGDCSYVPLRETCFSQPMAPWITGTKYNRERMTFPQEEYQKEKGPACVCGKVRVKSESSRIQNGVPESLKA